MSVKFPPTKSFEPLAAMVNTELFASALQESRALPVLASNAAIFERDRNPIELKLPPTKTVDPIGTMERMLLKDPLGVGFHGVNAPVVASTAARRERG